MSDRDKCPFCGLELTSWEMAEVFRHLGECLKAYADKALGIKEDENK